MSLVRKDVEREGPWTEDRRERALGVGGGS